MSLQLLIYYGQDWIIRSYSVTTLVFTTRSMAPRANTASSRSNRTKDAEVGRLYRH